MTRRLPSLAAGLALAATLVACGPSSAVPSEAVAAAASATTLEANVVKGRVTDARGAPMAGVQVFADHTMFHNANLFGTSDAQGNYRIELGAVAPSSWQVGAYVEREFDGIRHRLRLHEEDPAPFAGGGGAIRNLQWRVSGRDHRDGHYGEIGYVYQEGGFIEPAELVLEFEPQGPLVDGSVAETFTRVPDGSTLSDLPIGRYRITARHQPPGAAATVLPIRLRDTGEFAPSVEAGFRKDGYGQTIMELQVQVPLLEP